MKFKVGDKVRIVKNVFRYGCYYPSIGINDICTITKCNGCFDYPYTLDKYTNYNWCDEELELVSTNQKIVITTDGVKITTAKLYENGKVVKTAEAKCCPEDTFDFNVGAKLAVERLTAPVDEWKVVKRPVKVGDYIRLIKPEYSFDKVGDILKVDVVKAFDMVTIYEKNHPNRPKNNSDFPWNYLHSQYEVVEKVTKATEEVTEAPKYYNGKVVCVDNCNNPSCYTIGKIYQFVNGVITNDYGKKFREISPVKDFGDWVNWTSSKFIEVVE